MTNRTSTVVSPAVPGPGLARPGLAFAVLATVQLTLVATITMLSLALPTVQREFHVGIGDLALASSAYGLSFSGLLLLGGRLADMRGRRESLAAAAAVFCLGSLLGMLSPDLPALVAARFVQGCGAALGAPAAMAMVNDVFPAGPRRDRALAVWGTLSSAGAVAGTLLGGATVTWLSWRLMFAVVCVVMLGTVGAAWRLLPARPAAAPERLDVPGTLLVTAGLTAASYGLIVATGHSWSSVAVVVSLALGALLLVSFVAWEARARQPLLPFTLFGSVSRVTALAIMLVTAASMSATFFFLSLYLQQDRGYSALRTSVAFLPLGLVLVIAGVLSGPFLARAGSAMAAVAGLLLAAAGLLLLGRLTPVSDYAGTLLVGLLALPAGACFAFAGATITTVREVPGQQAGVVSGVLNAAMETGPTIGLAALVSIAGTRAATTAAGAPGRAAAGYGLAFTVAGATMAAVAVLAAVALRPGIPGSPDKPEKGSS